MLANSQKEKRQAQNTTLPGRDEPITGFAPHAVLGTAIEPPYPPYYEKALFGMGCFWGVERLYWQLEGIHTTAVGYAGGVTPNPTYREVCSGLTGHNEVTLVVYDPKKVAYRDLLKSFWESHNPTQGMRQGNDTGTQYRSGIYPLTPEQYYLAQKSLEEYSDKVSLKSGREVTTEVITDPDFYFAEDYHQQYLAKNPDGYCNLQTIQKTRLPEFE